MIQPKFRPTSELKNRRALSLVVALTLLFPVSSYVMGMYSEICYYPSTRWIFTELEIWAISGFVIQLGLLFFLYGKLTWVLRAKPAPFDATEVRRLQFYSSACTAVQLENCKRIFAFNIYDSPGLWRQLQVQAIPQQFGRIQREIDRGRPLKLVWNGRLRAVVALYLSLLVVCGLFVNPFASALLGFFVYQYHRRRPQVLELTSEGCVLSGSGFLPWGEVKSVLRTPWRTFLIHDHGRVVLSEALHGEAWLVARIALARSKAESRLSGLHLLKETRRFSEFVLGTPI